MRSTEASSAGAGIRNQVVSSCQSSFHRREVGGDVTQNGCEIFMRNFKTRNFKERERVNNLQLCSQSSLACASDLYLTHQGADQLVCSNQPRFWSLQYANETS
jgi:hypothetical protein